jgi:L-alanine-DL-glutamate epimerase-like enolase superfamily enzyme
VRITSLEARSYLLPLDPPFEAAWDPRPRASFPETIVMVNTDEGVSGMCGGAPVPDLGLLDRLLSGADPENIEGVWGIVESVDFHGGRNWTVEVAVWDLLAKVAEVPLWKLLGGSTDRFRAYASTGSRVAADQRAERLIEWRQLGWSAAKIRFHLPNWRDDLKVVEAARSAVGDTMDLMVDANQGWRMPGDLTPPWDLATAIECERSLREFGVYWLEEPLPTQAIHEYSALRDGSSVLIAAGEMVRTLAESKRLIDSGAVDVIQNDVVLAGGIAGCRQIAALAHRSGVVWSPHTWSTGYGLLANLHAALAWSEAEYLEVPFDPPGWPPARRDYMLGSPLSVDSKGFVVAPPGPGLGAEPDLAALEQWRVH